MTKKLTSLIILDGFGHSLEQKGNAIMASGINNIKQLEQTYPHTLISASGLSVGLPEGQMGNSEVGHLNIGAGRVVYQALTRITKDIKDGGFFKKTVINEAIQNCKSKNSALHLYGLISNGGVHSHIEHLYAFMKKAKQENLEKVYIHCFMDGRDVAPNSGKCFIQQLEQMIKEINIGKIASVMGRYYAMDRDNRWERVEKAYRTMVNGSEHTACCAEKAMQDNYDKEIFDEFITPTTIVENGVPVGLISKYDSIICFNFRPDRAREITRTFIQKNFDGFKRNFFPVHYLCLTEYDVTFENVSVIYESQVLKNTFGEYLSKKDLKQFRIAETEKYAHVTFFFNGGVEQPNKGEDRILIPSPKVSTYDLQPEMSAYEVTDKACELIQSGKYDVMVLNFANPDMVGHTGNIEAATKAVTVVDECVSKVIKTILANDGEAIITSDHGNAEKMADENACVFTAHSSNDVPLILVSERFQHHKLKDGGILADIAPTMLELIGIEKPQEMTGNSLIIK